MHLASIKVQHYQAGASKEQKAWIKFPVNADVQGKRTLLVDAVNDTGETLTVARQHLRSLGPGDIRTAVLHEKPNSIFKVDHYGHAVRWWRWIFYPWAVVEDVTAFLQKLQPPARSIEEAARRLRQQYGLSLSIPRLSRVVQIARLESYFV